MLFKKIKKLKKEVKQLTPQIKVDFCLKKKTCHDLSALY